MAKKMKVLKGAGINADTLEIVVINEKEVLFKEKYYYGFGVSWSSVFATKEKPLDVDLIKAKAKEFDVKLEDVDYGEGINLFKETLNNSKKSLRGGRK